ncbi:MAG: hypothetical protein HUJ25_18450 [Crocinitomicaceae bacterium]|nr:hypothetical protein [Crocinitomicaceae bacterium]
MKAAFIYSLICCTIFGTTFTSMAQVEPFKLVSEPGDASCFYFNVQDAQGNRIKLPDHIQQALDCPYSVGLKGNFLTFVDDLKVKLYNLQDSSEQELFTLYNDIDGFSSPAWSDDGKEVLFVIVNQELKHNYKSMCRIIYLKLDEDGSILVKRKFDRPVNFSCGSICTAIPGEDFYFKGNRIVYKLHWIESDGEDDYREIKL